MDSFLADLTSLIRPKAARNKAGKYQFLVNGAAGEEDYIQIVRITQCMGDGEECGQGHLLSRFPTKCKQEYTNQKLLCLAVK